MGEEGGGASKLPLPESFVNFLEANGLDASIYSSSDPIPRYIRLKPGCESEIEDIEAEIECELQKVDWLSGFYSLPSHFQIASSKAYREGKIYGIDAASGAAVTALEISAGDHVLDLCAAPGAKLCMMLDLLGNSGSVTGVDVSTHRLAACRTMLQKYELGDRCRLFVADGALFCLSPIRHHRSCESSSAEDFERFEEWRPRKTWKERKQAARERENGSLDRGFREPELIFYGKNSGVVGLRKDEFSRPTTDVEMLECGYDKVLVDAECTHDGSIKHIQKFNNWGWKTLQRRVLDAERTDSLTMLQFKLLSNGFRLLKSGGSLVYSTCSLTVAQNENVVEQFLEENSSAVLVEIESASKWPCRSGYVAKTLRFDPVTSQTSGLFVAKFTKLVN